MKMYWNVFGKKGYHKERLPILVQGVLTYHTSEVKAFLQKMSVFPKL